MANLTVMGSVAASGMVPFNFWIALSASILWSNRINPTPFDKPINKVHLLDEVKEILTYSGMLMIY